MQIISFPSNHSSRCCSVPHYYTPVCKSNYNSVCPYYAPYLTSDELDCSKTNKTAFDNKYNSIASITDFVDNNNYVSASVEEINNTDLPPLSTSNKIVREQNFGCI